MKMEGPLRIPLWRRRADDSAFKQSYDAKLIAFRRPIVVTLWILAGIALLVFLKWAATILVSLLLGIMLAYTLAPFVNWLESRRIHRSVGTLLVLSILLGGAGWIGVALSGEVQAIATQLPDFARKLREKLGEASADEENILRKIGAAARELDKVAAPTDTPATKGTKVAPVPPPAPSAPVSSILKSWAAANFYLLVQGIAQAVLIVMLAYSLLAAGPLFRRKLISIVGPSLSDKKDALRTLEEIQIQLQSYLLWLTATNALIGLAIWAVFYLLGVENPGFWGVTAALLHFIPYAGPLILATASGLATLLHTGIYSQAIMIAAVALAVNGAIGVGVMTWMQARLYSVSATALFLGLLLFGWLWGAWGILLAAPLLGVMKVICDRAPSMERVAVFLAP